MGVQVPPGTPPTFHVKHFMNFPSNTKAVLFDMDGVLFNTEDLAHDVFEKLAKEFGNEFREDDHKVILGTPQKFWIGYLMEKWNLLMKSEDFALLFWDKLEKEAENRLELMPGALECVHRAKNGLYKIALVTSTPMKVVEPKLKRLGMHDLFDVIVTGDQTMNGKPHPDPYLMAMKRLGVEKNECVVIEDALSGVRSGKAAGCYVIAVPTKHAEGLDYSEADVLISSLHEIVG